MNKDLRAIIGTIFFVTITLLIFYLLKNVLKIEGDFTYVSLTILPVLIYAILADKIKSFKAGEIEATFKEMTNKSVKVSDGVIKSVPQAEFSAVTKGSSSLLDRQVEELNTLQSKNKIILTLELGGHRMIYHKTALEKYVVKLSMFSTFQFAVIQNNEQEVYAFIPKDRLIEILRNDSMSADFVNAINSNDKSYLDTLSGLIKNKVTENTRNIDALKEMDKEGLNQLIVVDKYGKLKGIVEREDLLSKLLIALADAV